MPRAAARSPVATITSITLHTALGIEECQRRLTEGVDFPQRTIASLSGYRGNKPVLGRIEGHRLELRKRKYYHNDFAPVFFGSLSPQSRGTRIEGHFDSPRWVKIFWGIWCGFVLLLVMPIFIVTAREILRGGERLNNIAYVGLLVPAFMLLVGGFMPKFGRWIGRHEEVFLVEFLKNTLAASDDLPSATGPSIQPSN